MVNIMTTYYKPGKKYTGKCLQALVNKDINGAQKILIMYEKKIS